MKPVKKDDDAPIIELSFMYLAAQVKSLVAELKENTADCSLDVRRGQTGL